MDTTASRSGASQPDHRSYLHNIRLAFRNFRRSRPFWAGVWTILGGALIAYVPATAFKFALTPGGQFLWAGMTVGVLIGVFGLFLWLLPTLRLILAVLIIVLSLMSFITSDFGGLILGMLSGILGGSLAAGWMENPPPSRRERRDTRRAALTAASAGATFEVSGVPVDGVPAEAGVPAGSAAHDDERQLWHVPLRGRDT